MIDMSSLNTLIDEAEKQGAEIELRHRDDGWIDQVRIVHGVPGVGDGWMPSIQAAEHLRAFLGWAYITMLAPIADLTISDAQERWENSGRGDGLSAEEAIEIASVLADAWCDARDAQTEAAGVAKEAAHRMADITSMGCYQCVVVWVGADGEVETASYGGEDSVGSREARRLGDALDNAARDHLQSIADLCKSFDAR